MLKALNKHADSSFFGHRYGGPIIFKMKMLFEVWIGRFSSNSHLGRAQKCWGPTAL